MSSFETGFVNYYHCEHEDSPYAHDDPENWTDNWSCACNDHCPICNHEIEPYESEDLGAE
jgi:hypothetical protein